MGLKVYAKGDKFESPTADLLDLPGRILEVSEEHACGQPLGSLSFDPLTAIAN